MSEMNGESCYCVMSEGVPLMTQKNLKKEYTTVLLLLSALLRTGFVNTYFRHTAARQWLAHDKFIYLLVKTPYDGGGGVCVPWEGVCGWVGWWWWVVRGFTPPPTWQPRAHHLLQVMKKDFRSASSNRFFSTIEPVRTQLVLVDEGGATGGGAA